MAVKDDILRHIVGVCVVSGQESADFQYLVSVDDIFINSADLCTDAVYKELGPKPIDVVGCFRRSDDGVDTEIVRAHALGVLDDFV